MKRVTEIRKVALIGDYLPRKCGIATFTHDVRTSVASQFPATDCFVVPVNDIPAGYDYPHEVRFEIAEQDLDSYLRALPTVLKHYPNLVYIILGATHPNLVREQGESYRMGLERLARQLGLQKHVIFYNRFVELTELTEFISAADVYVTPYLNPAQITSGTLAYAFGSGKAVISTPYWHAEELLADDRGVLVPFADSGALARELIALLKDESRRHAMRKRAYLLGREMVWSQVAHRYMDSFRRARRGRADTPLRPLAIRTLDEQLAELPDWRLDHLLRLTDSTAIIQHATYTIPTYAEGYCTDDTARALLLTVLLEQRGPVGPEMARLASTYAAFVQAAATANQTRFRNFMSYDRRWLEEIGSDDCHGRALWALGACVGRSRQPSLPSWAAQLFDRALPAVVEMTSPRAWAFTLLGIHEYFKRLSGDRLVAQVRDTLTARLLELFDRTATDEWQWFEEVLSYDNARLPQALIQSATISGNARALEVGLRSLRWLMALQKAPQGHFRPVGSNGFARKGGEHAQFDQQPLEAAAGVSACLAAFRATQDPDWLREALSSFDWFLGRNDLGLELYDASSGGCRDGLHQDRANQNQGAESTLSFLLALAEMKLIEEALAAYRHVAEADVPEPGRTS